MDYATVIMNSENIIITLAETGALYTLKVDVDNNVDVKVNKCAGYLCRLCCGLFIDLQKLEEHVARNHVGPVSCDKCSSVLEDLYMFKKAQENIFCPVWCDRVHTETQMCKVGQLPL